MKRFITLALTLGLSLPTLHAQTLPTTAPTTSPATKPAYLPNGQPTLEELVRLLQDQKANEVLQHVAHILASKKLTEAYELADLLMLKAEALLQNHNASDARALFLQAAKEAPDPDRRAYAIASELIVRRATIFQYTPKSPPAIQAAPSTTGKTASFDVRDIPQRRAAFQPLFLDEVEAAKPKIKTAMKATALPPIAAAVQPLCDLAPLERAATGKEDQIRKAKDDLADHLAAVVTAALRTMSSQLDTIQIHANEIVQLSVQQPDPLNPGQFVTIVYNRKRGLDSNDTTALRAQTQTCAALDTALRDFTTYLELDAKKLDPQLTQSKSLNDKALKILSADYSTETRIR